MTRKAANPRTLKFINTTSPPLPTATIITNATTITLHTALALAFKEKPNGWKMEVEVHSKARKCGSRVKISLIKAVQCLKYLLWTFGNEGMLMPIWCLQSGKIAKDGLESSSFS